LRKQARDVNPPSPWRSGRNFESLAGRFAEALTAAKGEVLQARDLEEALNCISDVLREIEARSAVANDHPILEAIAPPDRWPDVNWHVVGRTEGDARAFSAAADVGLSVADAALAETGTVVVSSGPGRSRLTGLLPPVHLVLVPTSCLTVDLFTWTAGRQRTLPSAVTLISGPSKTADIEQTLTVGVHGPKRFIAVLYED
jgi:L-lactate utilization protein LutC